MIMTLRRLMTMFFVLIAAAVLFIGCGSDSDEPKKTAEVTDEKQKPIETPTIATNEESEKESEQVVQVETETSNDIVKEYDFPVELEMIEIYNLGYDVRKKGPVTLSHAKHVVDYGVGCGECHHDENGEPLADLELDDDVQGCVECHPLPEGENGKDEYQTAMHKNCRTCHVSYNRETDTKDAPVICNQCHEEL